MGPEQDGVLDVSQLGPGMCIVIFTGAVQPANTGPLFSLSAGNNGKRLPVIIWRLLITDYDT